MKVIRTASLVVPVSGASEASIDVYLDDEQVNAFAEFRPDSIVIDVPFKDLSQSFKVKIVNRQTRETQFEETFRFAHSEMFDTVETSGSFQADGVYRFYSNARPRPVEYDRRDAAFDFRGDGKVAVNRGLGAPLLTAKLPERMTATNDCGKPMAASRILPGVSALWNFATVEHSFRGLSAMCRWNRA
jgi:hypothetical protein